MNFKYLYINYLCILTTENGLNICVSIQQSAPKSYRGIIFDMDGTLTRTNQLIFDSFNFLIDKYLGRKFSNDEIIALFGPPEDVAIRKLVDSEKFDEAMNEFYSYYKEHHNEKAELYDGITDILDLLYNAHIQLGLFTGKGSTSTEITLDKFGLRKYFSSIVTGHDVVRHKPSGEGISKALNELQLSVDEALMVGDAVADVKASREAGVDIAAVLWDSYGYDTVIRLDTNYRFTSVDEFRSWIDHMLSVNNS